VMASQVAAVEQGATVLEGVWVGTGPRFVHIAARFHNRCGGCGGHAPAGMQITYDRLERAAYHPGCAWVAIEQTPWLIPMPAGDEPMPGQVIAHPAYGWLVCVRVAARVWADNGISAGGMVGVAARRALPEEVDRARWRAYADFGDAGREWLDPEYVGQLADTVAEFTGWPITRGAREPEHFVAPHPGELAVFGQVASREDSEQWMAADPGERERYRRGYRWCHCFSVQCPGGEFGHVHLGSVIPVTRRDFDTANQRGWTLR
jgi:hypothetical protein